MSRHATQSRADSELARGAGAEVAVYRVCGKPKPFESTGRAAIAERLARAKELLDGAREAIVFGALGAFDALLRRVALDAALDEFGDESRVADRFEAAIDEELRVQCIVDETVGLARIDGRPNLIAVVAAPCEARPQLRFG